MIAQVPAHCFSITFTRSSTRNANDGANSGAAHAATSNSDPLFQQMNLKTILLDIRKKKLKQINHKFDKMKKSSKDLKKSNKLLQWQSENFSKQYQN